MSVGAKTLPDPSARLTLDLLQRPTRLVQGVGAVDQAGALAKELGATNVLIVTDPGIVEAGHFDRLADSLTLAGIQILTYDKVRENPTTRDVDDCLDMAKSAPINCIVGLGGGSSNAAAAATAAGSRGVIASSRVRARASRVLTLARASRP